MVGPEGLNGAAQAIDLPIMITCESGKFGSVSPRSPTGFAFGDAGYTELPSVCRSGLGSVCEVGASRQINMVGAYVPKVFLKSRPGDSAERALGFVYDSLIHDL
jgi:hypothetical protein